MTTILKIDRNSANGLYS